MSDMPEVYYSIQYRIWSGPGPMDAPEGVWTKWKEASYPPHTRFLRVTDAKAELESLSEHPSIQYRVVRHTVEVVA